MDDHRACVFEFACIGAVSRASATSWRALALYVQPLSRATGAVILGDGHGSLQFWPDRHGPAYDGDPLAAFEERLRDAESN